MLLLTGAGRGFCAGQDLSDRAVAPGDAPVDLGASIERNYKPLVLALRALPMPVVCAVNGVAAGAGANLAFACDLVIAARSASFIQAFCKIGLVPDSGGTYFLPRLVGTARAMGLALLGDKITAEQAAQWGLIWQCVDDAELPPSTDELLAQLRAGADARARGDQAGALRVRRQLARRRSSTSSAISARARQRPTTIARASRRSSRSGAALHRPLATARTR